jgi:hypothetical protein
MKLVHYFPIFHSLEFALISCLLGNGMHSLLSCCFLSSRAAFGPFIAIVVMFKHVQTLQSYDYPSHLYIIINTF